VDKELTHLLKGAATEINLLREANHNMAARLDMFDKMMSLFHTQPASRGMGMGEDVVYHLNKKVAELENIEKK